MYHIIFPAAVTAALLKEGGVFRAYGERADGRQKLRIGVGEFKNSHFTLWVFAGRAALIVLWRRESSLPRSSALF